jgi:hypothetical protein
VWMVSREIGETDPARQGTAGRRGRRSQAARWIITVLIGHGLK